MDSWGRGVTTGTPSWDPPMWAASSHKEEWSDVLKRLRREASLGSTPNMAELENCKCK